MAARRRRVRRTRRTVRRHKMPARSKVTGRFLKRGSSARRNPRRRTVRRTRRNWFGMGRRRHASPVRRSRRNPKRNRFGQFMRGRRNPPVSCTRRTRGHHSRVGVALKRGKYRGKYRMLGCHTPVKVRGRKVSVWYASGPGGKHYTFPKSKVRSACHRGRCTRRRAR